MEECREMRWVVHCRYDKLEVQGCYRAEPMLFGVMPHPHSLPTVRAMDDDNAEYNPFSSSHVWNQTASCQDVATYDSSLFAPLELDSMFNRVSCAQTRRTYLTVFSNVHKVRPSICAETRPRTRTSIA